MDKDKDLIRYPTCKHSRYKINVNYDAHTDYNGNKNNKNLRNRKKHNIVNSSNDIKILWYLPVVDRIRYIFSDPRDAEMMTWLARPRDPICLVIPLAEPTGQTSMVTILSSLMNKEI